MREDTPPRRNAKALVVHVEDHHTGRVEYQVFKNLKETGLERPAIAFCRINTGHQYVSEREIIEAICRVEGVEWAQYTFYQLRTNADGGAVYRGYFVFNRLKISDVPLSRGGVTWCVDIDAAPPTACPKIIFDTFAHLVGEFRSLEEQFAPGNYQNVPYPVWRRHYRIAKKARRQLVSQEICWAATFRDMLPIDIALARHYRFDPADVRDSNPHQLLKPALSRSADGENWIIVDLEGSYLLRQLPNASIWQSIDESLPPERFTLCYL